MVEEEYARADADDPRFDDYFGTLQSIVTSTGQSDSGLFETSLRDERYLPFENSGVVSEWRLELPADPSRDDPRQFDYDTISDVILHIRYTAREGSASLRRAALGNLKALVEEARAAGSVRLFSVRHEFPTEWARFRSQTPAAGQRRALTLTLRPEHYPYWSQGRLDEVGEVWAIARSASPTVEIAYAADGAGDTDTLTGGDPGFGELKAGRLMKLELEAPIGVVTLFPGDSALEELWLAVRWGGAPDGSARPTGSAAGGDPPQLAVVLVRHDVQRAVGALPHVVHALAAVGEQVLLAGDAATL